MIYHNCIQGSPEWFALRLGKPSASCFGKIITGQGKPSKQRDKYIEELADEISTGERAESYQSDDMDNGVARECEARHLYGFLQGVFVDQVGCISDDALTYLCSPDGLIGEHGGLEIKCPKRETHINYVHENRLPPKYFPQVQGSLFVSGREWWDFMSYYPGMKPFIIRVFPDLEWHAKLEAELLSFNRELQELVERLR